MKQITLSEHKLLCENVFEISRVAQAMEFDRTILVEDSRGLFSDVMKWAEEFEEQFSPHGKEDYLLSIEDFANRKLIENYLRETQAETVRLNPEQTLTDFILFTRDTSEIWPWFVSAEEILGSPEKLAEIRSSLAFDPEEGFDTDALYQALDETFGISPALPGYQEQSW